jgi:predicted RNase H-like HicB family nuclease
MTQRQKYVVRLQRDEAGYWNVSVDGVAGVHTFGRTIAKAEEYARDALALWFGVEPVSFDLEVKPRLHEHTRRSVERARRSREKLDHLQVEVMETTKEAIRELLEDEHISPRDAARLLGISHQRVAQLVATSVESKSK